jgi:tRNA pseudouridine38-40 synthase
MNSFNANHSILSTSNIESYIALGIEYSGSHYCGWQKQPHSPSIQAVVETAISQICAQEVKVFCAGRTDTGVHATNQVIHFKFKGKRTLHAWIKGVNRYLPNDVVVIWCKEVDSSFHARFSAITRSYRYVIYNAPIASALLQSHVTWHPYLLDSEAMEIAVQFLLGRKNFKSFQASRCQSKTSIREIHSVHFITSPPFIFFDITANAFLHHMVRNIVGSLLQVGEGKKTIEWFQKVLLLEDRTKAANTASPNGLYLTQVTYPKHFSLPNTAQFPLHHFH